MGANALYFFNDVFFFFGKQKFISWKTLLIWKVFQVKVPSSRSLGALPPSSFNHSKPTTHIAYFTPCPRSYSIDFDGFQLWLIDLLWSRSPSNNGMALISCELR